MKMRWLAAGLAMALAAGSGVAQTASQRRELDASTDMLARLMQDNWAQTPPQSRKVSLGPLFGAGQMDAAVLFSIEGFASGNNWSQYLAVFEDLAPVNREAALHGVQSARSPARHYRLIAVRKVGGSADRAVGTVQLQPGQVLLAGKRNAARDSVNHPTEPFTDVLAVSARELTPVLPAR